MSGWRPALRIARRNARRHPGRSLLIAILVALPVAGATMVDLVARTYSSPERRAQSELGSADAAAVVTGFTHLDDFRPTEAIGTPSQVWRPDRDPADVDLAALLPRGSPPSSSCRRSRCGSRSVAPASCAQACIAPIRASRSSAT